MDQASAARARRGINRRGHTISVQRMTKTVPQTAAHRADIKAVVRGYTVEDLAPGVTAGRRKVILSLLDLVQEGFPLPLLKGDRIFLGDKQTTIEAIDPDRREYQGCLEIDISGA